MQRYSALSLARNALSRHRNWERAWAAREPKNAYDIVIIGGGGHGLATAYYLAREHRITNVAVIEKGWLGGGNTGRNTTIVRSAYLNAPSIALYELSRSLFETLSGELNFNVMFSARGVVTLCLSEHELRLMRRHAHAAAAEGVTAYMIGRDDIARKIPLLDLSRTARHPVLGALFQPDGGTARHDAVAWGYARAADALGVDIIENCAVTRIMRDGGRVSGVATARGEIAAKTVAVVAAAGASQLLETVAVTLPIENVTLQAMVSEPLKPMLDVVVLAGATQVYASQSDRGELVIGGAADGAASRYGRAGLATLEHTLAALVALMPAVSRVKLLRHWEGTVDLTPDRSPLIGRTPVEGLYLNCGWGSGGFKAIPGSGFIFADTLANGRAHELAAPFGLDRFDTGAVIDERTAAAVAH
jgi:sarcosine oxidase subunit beta